MITYGDTPSSLQLVQVVDGVGTLPSVEVLCDAVVLDVAQWEATAGYFCEFQDDDDRSCDSGSVCWGTSDAYEPKFCSVHYFDTESGYDFVVTTAEGD